MGHVLMARPVHHKTTRGQLAQLVEHLVDIEGVRGSSPLPPTTKAAIVKCDNRVLVMLSRRLDSRWWHHTITQKTQVGVVADRVL